MTLKEANKQLEKLENDYEYWLREKEELQKLVLPSSIDASVEVVDGGKRTNKLLQYVEKMDAKKINETLDYIFAKKQNLIEWIKNELKIMKKYGEIESLIIQYKEMGRLNEKGVYDRLTWEEISREVHWSKSFCRNVYRNYKGKRDIGE